MIQKLLGKDSAGLIGDQLTAFTKRLTDMVGDGGTTFTAEMKDSAISHFKHHTGKSGGRLTEDALEGIIADARAGLKPGEGALLSNVSEGNILTNAFNVDASGGIKGNLAAMGMGGLLGFAGAAATDGDGAHGAFIGSLVGGGIKGIGTGLARNMEKKFVGDLLGDAATNFKAGGVMPNGRPITPNNLAGTAIKDLPKEIDHLDPRKILGYAEDDAMHSMMPKTIGEMKQSYKRSSAHLDNFQDFENVQSPTNHFEIADLADTPLVPITSVRQQQISAIRNMSDDALKEAGMGAKFKKDVLTGESGFNIGTATRLSGFGGAALTGMGFSAKNRDHRRGFNKHRGNRV
jgi:hypothetical protein